MHVATYYYINNSKKMTTEIVLKINYPNQLRVQVLSCLCYYSKTLKILVAHCLL